MEVNVIYTFKTELNYPVWKVCTRQEIAREAILLRNKSLYFYISKCITISLGKALKKQLIVVDMSVNGGGVNPLSATNYI